MRSFGPPEQFKARVDSTSIGSPLFPPRVFLAPPAELEPGSRFGGELWKECSLSSPVALLRYVQVLVLGPSFFRPRRILCLVQVPSRVDAFQSTSRYDRPPPPPVGLGAVLAELTFPLGESKLLVFPLSLSTLKVPPRGFLGGGSWMAESLAPKGPCPAP